MVSFNKTIAIGYARSPEAGIHELQKITTLQEHYLYLTAIGNFYLLQGNVAIAKVYLEKALNKTSTFQEVELIKRKIIRCI